MRAGGLYLSDDVSGIVPNFIREERLEYNDARELIN